ncbi:MAG TPA: hypothetical protein VHY75_09720 [Steroidobacteraceae bacterium]|nr:hypothetical protein [Steroidobacteraceae bacterium]
MKRIAISWLIALLMGVAAQPALADETVVLVVSADSKITSLDSLEVRKLFLGMTVIHDGKRVRPLVNEADPQLKEVFLQNIVSMTEVTYDRRVLRLALQQGLSIPVTYTDVTALLDEIAADPTAVTFAWAREVQHDKRIKVLRVLWHD